MKTSELTGAALDWAAAEALNTGDGQRILENEIDFVPYSADWAQGGPIIEREGIATRRNSYGLWYAITGLSNRANAHWDKERCGTGPTPLIAAMRCFVASKLGDEVEIPEELVWPGSKPSQPASSSDAGSRWSAPPSWWCWM